MADASDRPPLPGKLRVLFAIMGLAVVAEAFALSQGRPRSVGLVVDVALLAALTTGHESARNMASGLAYVGVAASLGALAWLGVTWASLPSGFGALLLWPLVAVLASLANAGTTLWCLNQLDVQAWLFHRSFGDAPPDDAPRVDGPPGDFACGACGDRYASGGACRRCPDEPLLDLRDGDIREMLLDQDDRRVQRRMQRLLVGGIPLGVGLTLAAIEWVPGVGAMVKALPFGFGFILACVGATMGLAGVGGRLFPVRRRFPDLQL